MGLFELMAAPFAECLVLVGIHTYLGIHVLRRRVIFVDLALAQIAALGTTVGFLFGILPETPAALIVSIAFSFVGAAVFSLTRIRGERVPQEAVIGLTYAITCALAVLVVEKTQGAEHLKDILVGSILWVQWGDVAAAAVAYAAVGLLHYVLRRTFFLISEDPEAAYRRGVAVRAWDFLFYVTFGFVIAFSTRVAGVLLVFVFLVAPAIMAFLLSNQLRRQLVIGWAMGTVVTVAGLGLSYGLDLPSGPTVVAFYGVALVLGSVALYVARAPRKRTALGWVATGVAATAAVCAAFYGGARWLATTRLAVSAEVAHVEAELERVDQLSATRIAAQQGDALTDLERTAHGRVGTPLLRRYAALPDAFDRLEFVQAQLEESPSDGLELLLAFLSDVSTPPFFRSEGAALLQQATGRDFGYDPALGPHANAAALERLRTHLDELARGGPDAGS